MDTMVYNQVKDIGACIRSITAGEAITSGNVLTVCNNNAYINKQSIAAPSSFTFTSNSPFSVIAIDSTRYLVTAGMGTTGSLQVVTFNGTTITGSGTSVTFTDGATPYVTMISATQGIVVGTGGSTSYPVYATTFTVSGTNITLQSIATNIPSMYGYSPWILAIDSTHCFISSSDPTTYAGYITAISIDVNGVITVGTKTQYSTRGAYYTRLSKIDSTHVLCQDCAGMFIATFTGGVTYSVGAIFSLATPNIGSNCLIIDSTHMLYNNSASFYMITISGATVVSATLLTPASGIIYQSLLFIDATHVLLTYGTGVSICGRVITIFSDYSVALGPVYILSTAYTLPTTAFMVDSSHVTILLGNTISNAVGGFVNLRIRNNSINDYSYNYGIALNSAAQGGTVSVLISGSSSLLAYNVGLYYNHQGILVQYDPESLTSTFIDGYSGITTEMVPTVRSRPYAVALSTAEIKILAPLSAEGVI